MTIAMLVALVSGATCSRGVMADGPQQFATTIRQITSGPKHHFFGYIGHVRTIPWNASGRYIVALETSFQDHLPRPDEAADIVLIDTQRDFAVRRVESTRAWNFQQGTMLYWNPESPESQFFFNDRNPETNAIYTVLFDIERGERVREYRFPDAPCGNSGIARQGGRYLGINYGRLARLRPVTGYPEARDWTQGQTGQPENDGIFCMDVATGEQQLLVSFRQLAEVLRPRYPDIDSRALFINHTLWSRHDERIYFYVRADFDDTKRRIDVPCTMRADGSDLRPLARHIGGHVDWESDRVLIGSDGARQIRYDIETDEIVGTLGSRETFPKPGGDVAVSPDGRWFVNGHGEKGRNYYTFLRRSDGRWARTAGIDQGGFTSGELRIDPAPAWSRTSTQLLVCGIANDPAPSTRQLFVIDLSVDRIESDRGCEVTAANEREP